jgi:beta-galactosidase
VARERIRIDAGWRFALGHAYDAERDFRHGMRPFFFAKAGYGDGPADARFDDRTWRVVDLPHDWAVELPFDERADTNHGSKALGRAFPENSVGWYRRALDVPASDRGRRIALEFDGVYRDSVVWVNGHYVGREPSGYSSFRYDVTDYLNYGGRNVVAVRVDATGQEGWWYEGAGIYRHVWLTKTSSLHVAPWGTFVRADVHGDQAELSVDVAVRNDGKASAAFDVEHELLDPDGRLVAREVLANRSVDVDATADVRAGIALRSARLWSLESPQLYTLRTVIRQGAEIVDRYDTPVGIRSARFDAKEGFFLNGQHVKLHGVDNHQDHAGVGVALPDGLQTWRLRRLKDMGVNAIRSSHHPATPELLDAADRLGMLVIDEHRMMGTTPQIRDEMERMVRRDRNHPSIILWSVGNEEWAIENDEIGTRLAQEMQAIVRRLDPTRGSTVAASSSGGPEGTAVGSEVLGFNYEAQHDIDAMHLRFPDRPMVVTEEGQTHATRGIYVDDPTRVHVAAYDRRPGGASTASLEEAWRYNAERPFLAGMFVWTGFDYRGETTPFGWPAISSQFGLLDTTGVMKDSAYLLQAAWTAEPMVHVLPHWNWPRQDGNPVDVHVYSNTEVVELSLNGRSLGRQALQPNGHLRWRVPYEPGTLVAKGYRGGSLAATQSIATTGAGVAVRLTAERNRIRADGDDIAVVTVNVVDDQGRVVPTSSDLVDFQLSGPVRPIGVGNGDPGSHEVDKPTVRYHYGAVRDWRIKGRADGDILADPAPDDAGWRDAFQWVPDDRRPAEMAFNVVRAQFERPTLAAGDRAELWVGEIAQGQRVFLNGALVTARPNDDGLPVIDLDPARLRDINTLAYVFKTPAGGIHAALDGSLDGARWACLRVVTPPGPWRRSVFNGYAQLIVRSSGERGEAYITATARGLRPARIRISAF